jgi:hypothetical protein
MKEQFRADYHVLELLHPSVVVGRSSASFKEGKKSVKMMALKLSEIYKAVPCSKIGSEISGANLLETQAISNWRTVGNRGLGKTYNEILQGSLNDCFFLAALSAVAWSASSFLSNHPNYTFRPISSINPTTGIPTLGLAQPYSPNDDVPVNASGQPIFARIPTTSDTWAMIYEKAYAMFKDSAHPQQPNYYQYLNGGNGWQALVNITGLANGIEYSATRTATQILQDLGLSTTTSQKMPNNTAAVAWTNSSGMPASLYASHTYSILGTYISGGTYIVLRNPYGGQTGGQIVNPEPTSGVSTANINWLATGINFSNTTDGIFALDINLFRQYFSRFGIAK